jgi:hypothetical protein
VATRVSHAWVNAALAHGDMAMRQNSQRERDG